MGVVVGAHLCELLAQLEALDRVHVIAILTRGGFEEGNLSLVGRIATRWDAVRFLSNLLRLCDEETRAPEIPDPPVARPIFIAGLPRSGTTFLHSLLAEDPANLVPRVWQLIHPYPPKNSAAGPDRRPRQVTRQLRLFALLAPDFRRMHPIDAGSPQECSEITAYVFASLRSIRPTTFRATAVGSTMRRVKGRLSTSVSRATDSKTASGSRCTKTRRASG
jgi:hypothetical protein